MPHRWIPDPDGVQSHGHWEPIAPPPTPQQEQASHELMKQTLTLTGATLGGMTLPAVLAPYLAESAIPGALTLPGVLARLTGAGLGGATGRMAAHTPEALVERTTGQPSGTTYGREGLIGGAEGVAAEALPTALEPGLTSAGTVLKWLGRAGLDNPALNMGTRARMAWLRGLAARAAGLGAVGDVTAAFGPIAATEAGGGLQRAGEYLGSGTLSQRAEGGLEWLRNRLFPTPPLSSAEQLAMNAEKYAAARNAPWRVPEPYPKPGWKPDDTIHVNPFGATGSENPEPFVNPPGVGETLDPRAGNATWQEWVRGGRVRGNEPGVTVNPNASTGNPPDWPANGRPPDETILDEYYRRTGQGDYRGAARALPPNAPAQDVVINPRGTTGEPPPGPAVRENPVGFTGPHPDPLEEYYAATARGDTAGAETAFRDWLTRPRAGMGSVGPLAEKTGVGDWRDVYTSLREGLGRDPSAAEIEMGIAAQPGGVVPAEGVKAPPPVLDPAAQAQTAGSVDALQRQAMTPQQLEAAHAKMTAQNAAAREAAAREAEATAPEMMDVPGAFGQTYQTPKPISPTGQPLREAYDAAKMEFFRKNPDVAKILTDAGIVPGTPGAPAPAPDPTRGMTIDPEFNQRLDIAQQAAAQQPASGGSYPLVDPHTGKVSTWTPPTVAQSPIEALQQQLQTPTDAQVAAKRLFRSGTRNNPVRFRTDASGVTVKESDLNDAIQAAYEEMSKRGGGDVETPGAPTAPDEPYPANLTPDQLAEYYKTGIVPPKTPGSF